METKQVIIIRDDLNMSKGKAVSQGAHASMMFLTHAMREMLDDERRLPLGDFITTPAHEWLMGSFKKVVCTVDSVEEMKELARKAREAGLITHGCVDSGKTEFNGVPTLTALAIGPDYEENFRGITDHLKLY